MTTDSFDNPESGMRALKAERALNRRLRRRVRALEALVLAHANDLVDGLERIEGAGE